MSEQCEVCGTNYEAIYWAPAHVWDLIKPSDQGDGGLLCVECAHLRARDHGITLRFPGTDQWWGESAPDHSPDAGKVVQGEPVPAAWAPRNWTLGLPVVMKGQQEPGFSLPVFMRPLNHNGCTPVYQVLDIGGKTWEDVSPDQYAKEDYLAHKRTLYTHPSESREEIQAQALEEFAFSVWAQFVDQEDRDNSEEVEKVIGEIVLMARRKASEARLRASQQKGNTARDDGEAVGNGSPDIIDRLDNSTGAGDY